MCFFLFGIIYTIRIFFFYLSLLFFNIFFFKGLLLNKTTNILFSARDFFFLRFYFLKRFFFFNFFFFFDYLFFLFLYYKVAFFTYKIYYKKKQFNSIYYFRKEKKTFFYNLFLSFFYTFKSIWNFFKFWVFSIFFLFFTFYFLCYIKQLPYSKLIFEWFLLLMFIYWLISGFVFFFKKYQFSKYTSVIQRFWKRSYILFWLIESGVFLVFFYLTLNASEEPVYMYDQIKLYKTHLFSWRIFLNKLVLTVVLIVIGYFFLLKIKWSIFTKQTFFLFIFTFILVYILWLEFYQFFHIVSGYGYLTWVFNHEDLQWSIEQEFKKQRLSNNYIALCLIAKFWHLVFIFVFWIFFILRINESRRVRYPLYSANYQNFIILYLMNWLYMYPWFKFLFRGFFDNSYYWFFINSRYIFFRCFVGDFFIFFYSFFFNNISVHNFYYMERFLFFYWIETSTLLNFYQFKKHGLRDHIINSIYVN
jgi:hypothetical protein